MDVLIGVEHDGWNRSGFVALIDGERTVRAADLEELAQRLLALGVQEHRIRLAREDDGDHAMSLKQQADFRSAWQLAVTRAG